MEEEISKFIDLFEYLYQNKWKNFIIQDQGWTSFLEGEEKIFGIIIRTLLCNDITSEKFYKEIGGYKGAISRYNRGEGFNILIERKKEYNMGIGKGAHRDERQRTGTPTAIERYLELTNEGQQKYYANVQSYEKLFNDFDNLPSIGPLTAFDLTKNLFEGKIIQLLPDRFYLTGGGQINGIKNLYPGVTNNKILKKKGDELMQIIRDRVSISEESLVFGLEDLLCIYQKGGYYKLFFEKGLLKEFGEQLLSKTCSKERGRC